MKSELVNLYKQRTALNKRIGDIEAAKRIAEHAAKVGKCFVYKNSYSHQNQWPLYTFVKAMDENGYFEVLQFETDSNGKTSVSNETRLSMSDAYREIDRAMFETAWEDALATMRGLFPTDKEHGDGRG